MRKIAAKVRLPSILTDCTGGRMEIEIEATTLESCLNGLFTRFPLLKIHLLDEQSRIRRHVNIFYNERSIKVLEDWRIQLSEGDMITVLQAVSGG